jgi:hypothetical protein
MPLLYLLDESLCGGGLWQAVQQHNSLGLYPIDILRVGDCPALPRDTSQFLILFASTACILYLVVSLFLYRLEEVTRCTATIVRS